MCLIERKTLCGILSMGGGGRLCLMIGTVFYLNCTPPFYKHANQGIAIAVAFQLITIQSVMNVNTNQQRVFAPAICIAASTRQLQRFQ